MFEKSKSIEDFLKAKRKGQREFENWDFEEGDSAKDLDLKGISFRDCFLFLDFKNANLENASFYRCNLKMADFTGANLTNVFIKNCSVESIILESAIIEKVKFIENYAYGAVLNQRDFERLYDKSYIKPVIKIDSSAKALEIATDYLTRHPGLNLEFTGVAKADSWRDGNKNCSAPVWLISYTNLNPRMESTNYYTIVVGVFSGIIEDISCI